MTENEAKEMLQAKLTCMNLEDLSCIEKGCSRNCNDCEYNYAQGTKENKKEALSVAIKAIEEIQQYRAIGTVEECREAMGRQIPKKPRFYAHNYYCGNCGNLVGNSEFNWKRFQYCDRCGNAVDWSE